MRTELPCPPAAALSPAAVRRTERFEVTDTGMLALKEAGERLRDGQEAKTKLLSVMMQLRELRTTRDGLDTVPDACCPSCQQPMKAAVRERLCDSLDDDINTLETDRTYLRQRLVQLGAEMLVAGAEDDRSTNDESLAITAEEPFLGAIDDDDDELPF